MADINLLNNGGESKAEIGRALRSYVSFYIVFGLVLIEAAIFGFIYYGKQKTQDAIADTERQSAEIDVRIAGTKDQRDKAISFQTRLENLEVLLSRHTLWSKLFSEVEANTLKNAFYLTMQADDLNNKVILSGVTPSYTDLGKLIEGLKRSTYVKEVQLNSVSVSDEEAAGYIFEISIFFNPEVLENK